MLTRLAAAVPSNTSGGTESWGPRYASRILVTDVLVIAWAVTGAHVIRFGAQNPQVANDDSLSVGYFAVSAALVVSWLIALSMAESRDKRIVGSGPEEYRRILVGSFRLFGSLAIIAFAVQWQISRSYLLIAFPIGMVALLVSRWLWRQWLHLRRQQGGWAHRVVVVGGAADTEELVSELLRDPKAGYKIVGLVDVVKSDDTGVLTEAVVRACKEGNADTVAIAGDVPRVQLRRLAWVIEDIHAEVVVAPALIDVAGPRIHVRPAAGLSLLHIEPPQLPRGGAILKEVFDRTGAIALILLFAPLMLAVATAIALTSPGPVFYRQARVGRAGHSFRVWKFRSMELDADERLVRLLESQGRSHVPLFKPHDDPRITSVGRYIRKYSLDELPQLFNVLTGEMSLVGPRPQRAEEVALYDRDAERRLLAKPGMTGLWQVSGRSNLPWDRAVRLDLYYVENWSFSFDLLLLWRTLSVVTRGVGAR